METCHEKMPSVSQPYFANFTPSLLALICEATMLEYRLGVWASIGCGLIWSAMRAIEHGQARCPALKGMSSQAVEEAYMDIFRPHPSDITAEQIQRRHGYNLPVVLPPRCSPQEPGVDVKDKVTVGKFIAAEIAKWDFTHALNIPLRSAGIDLRVAYEALVQEDGFVPGPSLEARGRIPEGKRALYEAACRKAAYAGTWLVRDLHVAMAAIEMGTSDLDEPAREQTLKRWDDVIAYVHEVIDAGGCIPFLAIPGSLPWAASACESLGLESGLTEDDLARNEALPHFIEGLKNADAPTRRRAAWDLVRVGAGGEKALPDLTRALKDADTATRRYAAWALGRIGRPAGSAATELIAAMKDDDPKVREQAAKAFRTIGAATDEVVSSLAGGLEDKNKDVRSACAEALACIGPEAAPAVPALAKALKQGLWNAPLALGAIGKAAKRAVPSLIEVMNDEKDHRRCGAASAVAQIDPTTAGLVNTLVEILHDKGSKHRIFALGTLREMGKAAKDAVPHIIEASEDEDPDLRTYALWALREIDPDSAPDT